jgi:hypothetical protein
MISGAIVRPAGRSLGRFVDLLLTWRYGIRMPHVISDAGYWNDWDI